MGPTFPADAIGPIRIYCFNRLAVPVGTHVRLPLLGALSWRRFLVGSLSGHKRFALSINRKPPFEAKTFLANVGEGRSISNYAKGQIVFSQGDIADAVFYIEKGKAKVSVVSEQGKEAIVSLLGSDDFFGEGCLAGQTRRIATVTAMVESAIVRLERAVLVRTLHDKPDFAEMFMAHVLKRTIRGEKRLARLLLLMANYGKETKPEPIIAKLSQEVLAEMIGTTRSRVSFFMNKFRDLGFIEYNGDIKVNSSLLNVVLHDQTKSKN
jgi:CRP-like cAMP-binding protein